MALRGECKTCLLPAGAIFELPQKRYCNRNCCPSLKSDCLSGLARLFEDFPQELSRFAAPFARQQLHRIVTRPRLERRDVVAWNKMDQKRAHMSPLARGLLVQAKQDAGVLNLQSRHACVLCSCL